jgi:hypothetical protein
LLNKNENERLGTSRGA